MWATKGMSLAAIAAPYLIHACRQQHRRWGCDWPKGSLPQRRTGCRGPEGAGPGASWRSRRPCPWRAQWAQARWRLRCPALAPLAGAGHWEVPPLGHHSIDTRMSTYLHTFHTYIYTYIHTYVHRYIHTYGTYIHTYIRTYIHTYTHKVHTYGTYIRLVYLLGYTGSV